MKLRVETTALTNVLQKLLSVSDKKTNLPVLSNTLIKATPEKPVELSATDLEISIKTQLAADVEFPGMTTVSVRKLLEVVRELPYQHLKLEVTSEHRLQVSGGRSRFELQTIPAEDFPHLSFQESLEFNRCDAEMLGASLNKIFYGIPVEDDHFNIAGLYWHSVSPAESRVVSCDGHRLAFCAMSREGFPDFDQERALTIPRKGVQEIIRLLEREKEVGLAKAENSLVLRTSSTVLSVQLLDAEMPNYDVIIPSERPWSLTVDRDQLFSAVKRVAVLTNQRWRHMRFMIRENTLELEAGNPEIGYANDVLDVDYSGEEFSICFNARYVLDALESIESQKIRFEWLDDRHGAIFVGPDDPSYFSLVMPMIVGS